MTGAANATDKLRGVTVVVTSQQNHTTGRFPGRVSQSGLRECGGVWGPAGSVWLELQAVSGGVRIDSTTENVPCESVPHSGTAGDVLKFECLQSRR